MINNLPYNNTIRDYYLSTNKNVSSFSDSEDSSIRLENKKNVINYYEILPKNINVIFCDFCFKWLQ